MSTVRSKKASFIRSYLVKKYDRLLDSILVAEEAISSSSSSESNGDSGITQKELIQKIAGSLVNASIEKFRLEKDDIDTLSTDYDMDSDSSLKEPASEVIRDINNEVKEHFVDLFVDKLISRIISEKLPEREHISLDQHEKALTATLLANNMKTMTSKLGHMMKFQDSVIRLITWRNPTGTLLSLSLFTFICYYPLLLMILPLILITFGIMVPKYLEKYPIREVYSITRKSYGSPLLLRLLSVTSPDEKDASLQRDKSAEFRDIGSSALVVVNLRDFQNMTSSLIELSEVNAKLVNETLGFEDERHTTVIFLLCIASALLLNLTSPFVNWSLTLSLSTWLFFIMHHPQIGPRLDKFIIKIRRLTSNKFIGEVIKKFDIILDEKPQINSVEVFEIYRQGIVPGVWKFFLYSSNCFDPSDEFRRAKHAPPGVKDLEDVKPPESWLFDPNSEWEIDYNVEKWSYENGLDPVLTIEDEYLCDTMFKRRRLTRRVLK
ncbi:hypothetical protein KAFR_0E02100 [Kazachstania africana CBS 2517]|uniref:TECPR1-like DysF domain-containing protein n=1 Tax=Kazachstania africana (strain ATCC 22294 / BCRC 22015 / CBS 2517 / CECT 1963 / NBRC 1671 / NRRL Y-8276) TaxID=1071382 RepID=H2AVG3_KAZAF|nr:hypothetical protein KAFR_0E02100 [Kazachstania africana CBS 2517]CCF58363.1 hypothetical protein KAFR_0E02100 [Kazachstania africana CBS 2517]